MTSGWHYTPYIIPLLITTLLAIGLAGYSWRHRTTLGAVTFTLLMLAVAEWSLGYTLELSGIDLATKVFWGKVQYLGIVTTPVAWLAFALQYTNQEKWLTRRNVILAAIIPLLTVLLVWTTEGHGLVWQQISLNTTGPFPALDLQYGAWFWINWSFAYVMMLLGTLLFIRMVFRSSDLYRWQSLLSLFIALAPWIGNGIYILRLSPIPNLDWTPFVFALSGVMMAWNLFRFRLLDIVPVARRAVVDSMSDGIIVLDAQNRIVDINPAAQDIVGVPAVEAIGQADSQILSHWPDLIEGYQGLIAGQAEIVLRTGYAGRAYFDMRISPLYDQQEHLTGRLIVLRDITERKEAEEALAQARDQALEASRLKSELLAKVSHELRTPLGIILGYAELLQHGDFGSLTDQQEAAIIEMIKSSQNLAHLVDELLDQAQFETGKVVLKVRSFVLEEMVSQVETQMNHLAQAKGLTLTTNIAADMPATLSGDPHRLQQILVNLVGNAIKFTNTGAVTVQFYCPDQTQWAIEVSDTGPGIAEEAYAYIFEPFRQVDGSITRRHGGVGLGLSIVKQLTTLMGGQITLESNVGQGSTFTILLPTTPTNGNRVC